MTARSSPTQRSFAGMLNSTFIRWHVEKKYGVDFDAGLTPEQRAVAWAFEKMAEDHFYWALFDARWMDESNFAKGPKLVFFRSLPTPMRPLLSSLVRRKVRRALHSHGMGRHAQAEIMRLAIRSIDAIADYLGGKPFFLGAEPVGVDATIFAFVAGALCPLFESPLRSAAERHDNLRRYVGRMTKRFHSELDELAGCKAAA
jgi:hypothetical protein